MKYEDVIKKWKHDCLIMGDRSFEEYVHANYGNSPLAYSLVKQFRAEYNNNQKGFKNEYTE